MKNSFEQFITKHKTTPEREAEIQAIFEHYLMTDKHIPPTEQKFRISQFPSTAQSGLLERKAKILNAIQWEKRPERATRGRSEELNDSCRA